MNGELLGSGVKAGSRLLQLLKAMLVGPVRAGFEPLLLINLEELICPLDLSSPFRKMWIVATCGEMLGCPQGH